MTGPRREATGINCGRRRAIDDWNDRGVRSQRESRRAQRLDRFLLLCKVYVFRRFQSHHEAIAGAIPGIAVGGEQIENNAGNRRIAAVLIDADRRDVFFLDLDSFLNQPQT